MTTLTATPKKIVLHHTCGHIHRFTSPGMLDPFGEYQFYVPSPKTGEVNLNRTIDCYGCRKEKERHV